MERYIKIYDKLIESPVFKNEKLLKVWIWCLLKATYKPYDAIVGRQVIHLEEGQFIFGVHIASETLNIAPSTIYSYMKMLEQMGSISIKAKNKYSLVTVENWAFYQSTETKTENKRKTNEKQTDTYKNIKNIIPPTLEMVSNYIKENNYQVDAEKFINYYESKGWLVGKTKMKDWQASVRTWQRNSNPVQEEPKVKYRL